MDVCLSVVLWLSVFICLALRDSSCIFITRPDLIFKTLVRYSAQVQLSHKVLTMKNKRVCFVFWLKTAKIKNTYIPPMLQLCIISSYFILLQSLYVCQYRSVWSVSLRWICVSVFVCVGGLYPKSMDYTVPCTSMSHSTLTSLPPIWRLPRDSQTEGRVRATGHRVNKCFPQTTFQCSLEHENTDKTNTQSLPCSHHYRLPLYSVLMSCCLAVLLRQLHFSW